MTELALAEWGLRPGEYTDAEAVGLMLAWLRRKRFEALLTANAVGRLFGAREERWTPDDAWQEIEALSGGQTR